MKKLVVLLFVLAALSPSLYADECMDVDIYMGAVNVLSYNGSQAGLRLAWPLHSRLKVGLDVATEVSLTETLLDNTSRTASFLRTHIFLRLSTSIHKLEPYIIGSFGKDLVGENPQPHAPHPYKPTPWFDSQWGVGWKAGLAINLSRYRIGAEMGGGTTATGYTDYNIVFGMTL